MKLLPDVKDKAAVTYISANTVFVGLEHELLTKAISLPVMLSEDEAAKLIGPAIRKQLAVTDPIAIFVKLYAFLNRMTFT